jgi:hypothetical protein
MSYFVKSPGPAVLWRGPFETTEEAIRKCDELKQDPMYEDQNIFVVEEQAEVEPERVSRPSKRRIKPKPARAQRRTSSRSSVGGGSSTLKKSKRRSRRNQRRRG